MVMAMVVMTLLLLLPSSLPASSLSPSLSAPGHPSCSQTEHPAPGRCQRQGRRQKRCQEDFRRPPKKHHPDEFDSVLRLGQGAHDDQPSLERRKEGGQDSRPTKRAGGVRLAQHQGQGLPKSLFHFVTSVFHFVTSVFLFVTSVNVPFRNLAVPFCNLGVPFRNLCVPSHITSVFVFVTSVFLFVTSMSFS